MNTDTINGMLAALRPVDASRVEDWFSLEQQEVLLREITSHRRPEPRTNRFQADRKGGRPLRFALPVLLVACVTAIAIGVGSTWNGGPSIAQAFPVLSGPTTLSPTALQQDLKIYGVDPSNDGLDIQNARRVSTPWGRAYVLTNAPKDFVCVAAPAPDPIAWMTSCGTGKSAQTRGTAPVSFGYDKAHDSVRVVALVPVGTTASVITDGQRATVPIHENLLALAAKPGAEVRITVHGRGFTYRVTRGATDQSAPGTGSSPAQGGTANATSTTAVGVATG